MFMSIALRHFLIQNGWWSPSLAAWCWLFFSSRIHLHSNAANFPNKFKFQKSCSNSKSKEMRRDLHTALNEAAIMGIPRPILSVSRQSVFYASTALPCFNFMRVFSTVRLSDQMDALRQSLYGACTDLAVRHSSNNAWICTALNCTNVAIELSWQETSV